MFEKFVRITLGNKIKTKPVNRKKINWVLNQGIQIQFVGITDSCYWPDR
jgi:hypothetical protein